MDRVMIKSEQMQIGRKKQVQHRREDGFNIITKLETYSISGGNGDDENARREGRVFISTIEPIHLKVTDRVQKQQKTCKMDTPVKFPSVKIESIAYSILKQHLELETYEETKTKSTDIHLCRVILREIKNLQLARYKFVCYVHIGEIKHKGTVIANRCMWDKNTENFAGAQFINSSLFATASVFGFYYE